MSFDDLNWWRFIVLEAENILMEGGRSAGFFYFETWGGTEGVLRAVFKGP